MLVFDHVLLHLLFNGTRVYFYFNDILQGFISMTKKIVVTRLFLAVTLHQCLYLSKIIKPCNLRPG